MLKLRKILFIKRYLLVVTFILFKTVTNGQHYNVQQFNVSEGLIQSQVLSLCQDKFGYIWQGTGGGISRFDGKNFNSFTTENGLLSNTVYAIKNLKNENLIFCTRSGINIYNHNKITPYKSKNDEVYFFDATEDDNNNLWLASSEGLYTFTENKLKRALSVLIDSTISIYKIHYNKNNNTLYLGTQGKGLISIDLLTQIKKTYITCENVSLDNIYSISTYQKNKILVGTYSYGAFIIDEQGNISKPSYYTNIKYDGISGYVEDESYQWFSTSVGLAYITNKQDIKKIKENNGLPTPLINCCLLDKENNIWLGTDGFGLLKFNRFFIVQYSRPNVEPFRNINDVFENKKQELFIASNEPQEVIYEKNETVKSFSNKSQNNTSLFGENGSVKKIIADELGNTYFIGAKYFCKYSNNVVSPIKSEIINELQTIYTAIFYSPDSSILLGSANGLYVYKNNQLKVHALFKQKLGTKKLEVYDITKKENTYYLSTSSGYVKFENNTFTHINENTDIADIAVFRVLRDVKQNEWIATNNGLFINEKNKIKNVSKLLLGEYIGIYSMLISKSNDLWFGTPKGLYKLSLTDYYNKKINIKNYSKNDGLAGVECSFNCLMEDSKNTIWVGTVRGLYQINPMLERKNNLAPTLKLEMPLVFNTPIDKLTNKYYNYIDSTNFLPIELNLPHNQNRITFKFSAISHIKPEDIVYRIKLDGYDNEFYEEKKINEREYVLEPGEYTFNLITKNADGIWNSKPIKYKFTISAPFWRQWWFLLSSLALLAVATIIFIKYRERKIKQEKVVLENEVAARTLDLSNANHELNGQNLIIAEQKKIVEEKQKEIVDSILYAQRIQQALLASEKILDDYFNANNDDNYFIYYNPKDIVSGDFYWATKTNDAFYMVIADCTGHGVPGAFMSLLNISFLNEGITQQRINFPNKVLDYVRTRLIESFTLNTQTGGGNDGMDAAILKFDLKQHILQTANAYNGTLIIRNKEILEIKADKMPIGRSPKENNPFTLNEFALQKGDYIYAYTDGYADQFGGPNERKFKLAKLKELILNNHQLPMIEQYNLLKNTHEDWKGHLEQLDDVLVFGMRVV